MKWERASEQERENENRENGRREGMCVCVKETERHRAGEAVEHLA